MGSYPGISFRAPSCCASSLLRELDAELGHVLVHHADTTLGDGDARGGVVERVRRLRQRLRLLVLGRLRLVLLGQALLSRLLLALAASQRADRRKLALCALESAFSAVFGPCSAGWMLPSSFCSSRASCASICSSSLVMTGAGAGAGVSVLVVDAPVPVVAPPVVAPPVVAPPVVEPTVMAPPVTTVRPVTDMLSVSTCTYAGDIVERAIA